MKIGNMLFPESISGQMDARTIHETLTEAVVSESLGVDMIWLAEHHFDGNCAYVDPITFAATLLGRTRRIGVGFAVLQTSLYHPVRLAEQLSLLDILADGRLVIGLGRGTNGNIYEYQGYSLDPEEAQSRYEEVTAILEKAFATEGPVEFDGRYWKIRAPSLRPQIADRPRAPFIHGASGEKSIAVRASRGEPFMMSPQSFAVTAHRLDLYKQMLRDAGLDAAAIAEKLSQCWVWRNVHVARTDAMAQKVGGEAMSRMLENRSSVRRRVFAEQGLPLHEKDRSASPALAGPDQGFICGSVETVRAEFLKLREIGVGGVISSFRLGPMPHETAVESLDLFMTGIAPALR